MEWFNEKPKYNFATNTCAVGFMCGHYTQVVWASTTTEVGCAHAVCQTSQFIYPSGLFVACNYGPPGNYPGESPYTVGPACETCTETCTDGLCEFSFLTEIGEFNPS
ncbi:hypothetical protein HELRODRAFT_193377 [Helobdella robusta]|uniref:SCP domain-containing protein n=1 Tax=Helobdella robusta TaxID=6412 RepID=T1FUX6_HELRO|nr:hypothetical protein HELRODRAFT_193377 [Helobdella robusta]ESN96819.1 hypothetical protein HELRODRAFT_193377 [Helobdella robusta]